MDEQDPIADQVGRSVAEAARSGASTADTIEMLQQGLRSAEGAGEMTPERRAKLDAALASFNQHVAGGDSADLGQQIASLNAMQTAMNDVNEARLDPSNAGTLALDSYAALVLAKLEPTFRSLLQTQETSLPSAESAELIDLSFTRQPRLRSALYASVSDARARTVEAEMARDFAVDVNRWLRRHHITLAEPYWPTSRVDQCATCIYYSGTQTVAQLVCAAVDDYQMGLDISFGSGSGTSALNRWHDIRAAAVCVFDFVDFQRAWPTARKVPYGQAAYDLGIALTLGRPIVVIGSPNAYVPFDVDVEVTEVSGSNWNAHDAKVVSSAIDAAYYQPQRMGGQSSVAETISEIRQRHLDEPNPLVSVGLAQLPSDSSVDTIDATRTAAIIESAMLALGEGAPVLLQPSWEGHYPHARSCFHITGFGIERAERVKQLVRESCEQQASPLIYLRGDDATDANIIRSIWEEICRASHVVVDISDLNLNALIELAIAHVLGRPALIITQDPSGSPTIPSLAKARRLRYRFDTEGEAALWAALWRFLGDRAAVPNACVEDGPEGVVDLRQPAHQNPATSNATTSAAATSAVGTDESSATAASAITMPEEIECAMASRILAYIEQVLDAVPPTEADQAALQYIHAVPGLLEGLHRSAQDQDELGRVAPLIDLVGEYFFLADDLIPDHLGALGLVDDAYVALRCIEKLNEWTLSFGNPPLLEIDLAGVNGIAASAMGAEITDQLDASIDWQITKASMKNWFGRNKGKALLGGVAAALAVSAVSNASSYGGGSSYSEWDALETQMNANFVSY